MLERDKVLHLAAGGVIALVVGLFFGVPAALIAALVAGVGKEAYDYKNRDKHVVEFADVLFTAMGGALGAFASEALKSLF